MSTPADTPPVYLDYLNRFDIEALGFTDAEILSAIEDSLRMQGQGETAIEPRHWVADVVYFPLETALLRAARARGCRVLPGSGMAIFQAVRAFRLFTGREADPARMRATFESFAPPEDPA